MAMPIFLTVYTLYALFLGAVTIALAPLGAIGAAHAPAICRDTPEIVPGASIGGIKLGAPFTGTVRALGAPQAMGWNPNPVGTVTSPGWRRITDPLQGQTGRAWAGYGVFPAPYVEIRATGNVIDVVQATHLPGCWTPPPVKVAYGENESALFAAYGPPDALRRTAISVNAVYDRLRLTVFIAPGAPSTVSGFLVFRPGRYCQDFAGPVCAQYTPPLPWP